MHWDGSWIRREEKYLWQTGVSHTGKVSDTTQGSQINLILNWLTLIFFEQGIV
jgi:hypothetical protein